MIYTQCELGHLDPMKDNLNIFLKDKQPLTSAQWPTVVASEKSPFIDIYIHFAVDSESDESEQDADKYLQGELLSLIELEEGIYLRSREMHGRGRRSRRASRHHHTRLRHQYQRTSTTSSGPKSSQSTGPYIIEDSYTVLKKSDSLGLTGAEDVPGQNDENHNSEHSNFEENGLSREVSTSDTDDHSTAVPKATK